MWPHTDMNTQVDLLKTLNVKITHLDLLGRHVSSIEIMEELEVQST